MSVPDKDLSRGFAPIIKSQVADRAVEMILEMVHRGDLQPGQALPSERQLASQLRVSRPTLREAIRALTTMNVLESHHGHGTFVTSLDPYLLAEPINFLMSIDSSAILSLFEARRILEVNVIELACQRIDDDELAALDELLEEASSHVDEPGPFMESDSLIHAAIFKASKNPILISLVGSISRLSRESRRRTVNLPGTRAMSHASHVELVHALHDRDVARARQAMANHLSSIEEAYRINTVTPDQGT